MSVETALLRAILDDPGDDLPRLAYADRLEEKNELPRVELIRVQIERARLHPDDDRQSELEARERRLLLAHGRDWAPAVLPLEWTEFRRGFLEALAPMPSWLTEENLPDLDPLPIRDLRLYGHDGELDTGRFREMDLLERIEALTLGEADNPVSASDIRDLLGSDRLTALRALDLSGNGLSDRDLIRILDLPAVRQVESLYLGGNGLADAGLWHLLSLPWPNLKRLRLGYNALGPGGYTALMTSDLWPRLEEIDLGVLASDRVTLAVMIEGIERMRARVLSATQTGENLFIPALCRASSWGGLESLDLNDTSFRAGEFDELLACRHLAGLRELHLGGYSLGPEDAVNIARCAHLANLTRLSLDRTPILGPLARSRHLTRLRYVEAWGDEDGVIDFVRSPNAGHVRWMNAAEITDRVAAAIAGSPWMGRLTTLHGFGALSDEGARLLADSPHLKNLTYLGVDTSRLSAAGQRALLEAEHLGWVGIQGSQVKEARLRRLWGERYGAGETACLLGDGRSERL